MVGVVWVVGDTVVWELLIVFAYVQFFLFHHFLFFFLIDRSSVLIVAKLHKQPITQKLTHSWMIN